MLEENQFWLDASVAPFDEASGEAVEDTASIGASSPMDVEAGIEPGQSRQDTCSSLVPDAVDNAPGIGNVKALRDRLTVYSAPVSGDKPTL